jgi:putative tryptophan/tyrosine transport system substrate-binding protein
MQFDRLNRRELITLIGGAAAAWPLAARAQQPDRMRRIGVLLPGAADDPEYQARVAAFLQGLALLGWTIGRNVGIDIRWAANAAEIRRHAAELVALAPDVILATGGSTVEPLQQVTRAVPIVFVQVADPVGGGFVETLARPGGNVTGFTPYEYSMSPKWLELLRQISPRLTRAAVLRDRASPDGIGQFAAMQGVAPSFGVVLNPVDVRDAGEIERAITTLVRASDSGLIVTASGLAIRHRDLVVTLAAQHKLPAVYPFRFFVIGGGLMSYGPDTIDPYRRAAGYVDRILRGEKPADLPVQAPTKYETVLNLKTAKALGLTVPDTLLARADEVIE